MIVSFGHRITSAAILSLAALTPAFAQSDVKRAAVVVPNLQQTHLTKNVFTGSESRIAAMHVVNADCTSGGLPDIRVATQPEKGELRLETIQYAVDRDKKDARVNCNGKLVDAVGVFYKAKDGAGRDKFVLDVDFKNGTVRRYSYTLNVR